MLAINIELAKFAAQREGEAGVFEGYFRTSLASPETLAATHLRGDTDADTVELLGRARDALTRTAQAVEACRLKLAENLDHESRR